MALVAVSGFLRSLGAWEVPFIRQEAEAMTAYRNFTVDFPARIEKLDKVFAPMAASDELEVTYLLMKVASAFLLPYERMYGDSGATRHDVLDPQGARAQLELDKKFVRSSYCDTWNEWRVFSVVDFSTGPLAWLEDDQGIPTWEVASTLKIVRHALAHSNIYFGGENSTIQHIYFGNRADRARGTDQYKVIRGSVQDVKRMIDTWLKNLHGLRASSALVWQAIDEAA
jgi:hypothetical protein